MLWEPQILFLKIVCYDNGDGYNGCGAEINNSGSSNEKENFYPPKKTSQFTEKSCMA
jgi:hypothetical protein